MKIIMSRQIPTLTVAKAEPGGIKLTKRYLGGMEREIVLEPDEIEALHKYLAGWLADHRHDELPATVMSEVGIS